MLINNTKHQIIEAARAYMQSNGLSQDGFTEHVKKMNGGQGINVAYLNDMLKGRLTTGGKQTPIDDKYFHRVAKAINFVVKKSYRKHHDTDNYLLCMQTFSEARDSKMPMLVDGLTGEGKTYAALEYLRQNPKNSYYVRCDGDLTAKSFFVEFSLALGLSPYGPIADLRRNVIHKLRNETDPFVIVDEAENMKDRGWDSNKRIMDDLKGICSIVYIAANNFEAQLQKKADKGKGCYPQILRRLREGGIVQLFQLTIEDAMDISKQYGITSKQHVRAMFDKCRNTAELTSMIAKVLREADQNDRNVLDLIELYCNMNLKVKA